MNEPYASLFFWDFNQDWRKLVGELIEGVQFSPAELFGRRVDFGQNWPEGNLSVFKGASTIGGFISIPQSQLHGLVDSLGLELEDNRLVKGCLRGNTLMNVDCRVVQPTRLFPDTRSADHRYLANLFLYGAFEFFSDTWKEFFEVTFAPETLADASRLLIEVDLDPELPVRGVIPGDLLFPSHSEPKPDLRESLRVYLIGKTGILNAVYENLDSVRDLLEKLDANAFGVQPQTILLQPSRTGFTIPIGIDASGWRLIRSGLISFPPS